MNYINTNICALSTPQGSGAIAIIRLSGEDAIDVIDKIFTPAGGKEAKPYLMRYGSIKDGDRLIDECMVATFNAPHSYTGENSAEIYCHGSSYIIQEILKLLLSHGVKLAEPGEFSKRAFLNGKLDLAQAEAVADLISSETSAAHRVALQQMKGGFSNELQQMRSDLLNLVSMMELELDFSEEDVEFADRTQLKLLLAEVTEKVASLIESFTLGNVIKNGVPVAIVGATNTGKSTLLNTLLGEEKAIVSNIHGTTRDVIEDTINLGGITFRFIDTAGIRETQETIEIIGIERTYMKLKQASIVIMVLDATRPEYFESSLINLSTRLNKDKQKLVILLNKADKIYEQADALDASDAEKSAGGLNDSDTADATGEAAAADAANMNNITGKTDAITAANTTATAVDTTDGVAATAPEIIFGSPAVKEQLEQIKRICANVPDEADAANAADGADGAMLSPISILPISAKRKLGITELKELLISSQQQNQAINTNATLVTNVRHYQALMDAQIALYRVEDGLTAGTPTDLVAQDIREALYHLGSIVGEINTEEVLGNIFGRFCIGK
ncbi:MAG: tRNA uridine-5-carboxymethylaminomethyl(34) synthesis GTPase MnmE [Bacteroidales bacterium]|nr:tRNA uridine-5-carboxymethylaminomethyl(34) synthesis GTPase MnmE [Bacteroidales bacterium]